MTRINYRLSFANAEGDRFPGPVFQAPDEAVEVVGVELWLVPEEPYFEEESNGIPQGMAEEGAASPPPAVEDSAPGGDR